MLASLIIDILLIILMPLCMNPNIYQLAHLKSYKWQGPSGSIQYANTDSMARTSDSSKELMIFIEINNFFGLLKSIIGYVIYPDNKKFKDMVTDIYDMSWHVASDP